RGRAPPAALGGETRLEPFRRKLVSRLELLEAPADLRRFAVVVVDGGVGKAILRFGERALDLLDEVLHRGHNWEVSRVVRAENRARPASCCPRNRRRRGPRPRDHAAPRAAPSLGTVSCPARACVPLR